MKFLKSIWNKLSVFEFAGDHKTEEKAAETSIRGININIFLYFLYVKYNDVYWSINFFVGIRK